MAKIEIIKAFPGSPKVGSQVTLDPRVEKFYASPKHKEFYKIIIEVGDYIVFLKSFDDCKEGDVVRIDKVEKENKSSSMHSGIWLSYIRPNRVDGGFKIKTASNCYTYGEDFRLATRKEISSISTFPELCEKVIEKDYKILSLARFCSIKPTERFMLTIPNMHTNVGRANTPLTVPNRPDYNIQFQSCRGSSWHS